MSGGGAQIELNPEWLDRSSHIALLNQGFPGQWDRAAYDWYVARPFGGVANDTFVVSHHERALAAVTLCHRQVGAGGADTSRRIDVGVMSAGTTLRSEQGRGHYGRLLEAIREHACRKGYAALLGFVTRDNASARGLFRRGARGIPSFYIVSVSGRGPRRRPVRHGAALGNLESLTKFREPERAAVSLASLARRESARMEGVRFLYERAHDWQQQFIARPNHVRALRLTHDCVALLETVRGSDRLQWLAAPREKMTASLASLASASAAVGRQFFTYTLDPLIAAAAKRIGLAIRPGYLMLWPTGCDVDACRTIADAAWTVQSGDRV